MLEFPWSLSLGGAVLTKASASRSGGRSIDGSEQVVGSGSGYWRAHLVAHVYDEMRTLQYQAFYSAINGMATEFLVPIVSKYRPRDQNGRMLSPARVAGMRDSRGQIIDGHEGWGWANTEPDYMWSVGFSDLRSTRLVVRHPRVVGLRPGHLFGIGYRTYLVARSWQIEDEYPITTGGEVYYGSDAAQYGADQLIYGSQATQVYGQNVQVIEFWPHLRAPVNHDTPLILGGPKCLMRFASDDTGVLDQGASNYGAVTLDLVEVI